MEGIQFIRDLGAVMLAATLAGWFCRRLGLSVIVGYLGVGILAGPYVPQLTIVEDIERIQTLSQLGLVFLMFSIGLQLSLQRLRSVGLPAIAATAVGAIVVFYLGRWLALAMGYSSGQGLFVAAAMMSSSSAVVTRAVIEAGRFHERSGQMAAIVTVLEDIVVVVMLALLTSYVQFGGGGGGMQIGETLGRLGAFVTLLGVGGLLLVPWMLRRMADAANEELQTLAIAGLLCALAYFAQRAGYSLAMGSFLLGLIVAETAQRPRIERAFSGLRDVFSAVFFVAIGMMVNPAAFGAVWWQVLLLAGFALFVRSFACTVGQLVSGQSLREAIAGGLSLTPLGEFGFIIAQLAVTAHVLPESFQPVVVGAALLTALAAPPLAKHAPALASRLAGAAPRLLQRFIDEYDGWLDSIQQRQAASVLWRLSKKRLVQLSVGVLFVTGWLGFMPLFEDMFISGLAANWKLPVELQTAYWMGLLLVSLAPLVAIWNNVGAMAMLVSEVTTAELPNSQVLRRVVEAGLRTLAGVAMFVWLTALMPLETEQLWVVVVGLLIAAVVLGLLWRKLIYWQSQLEVRIGETLQSEPNRIMGAVPRDWDWTVEEVVLPEESAVAGKPIGELALRTRFGVTVVGIDRHGFVLTNPGPGERLYPRDHVFVAGSPDALKSAHAELGKQRVDEGADQDFIVQRVNVPENSPWVGKTLIESAPGQATGAQVAAIKRGSAQLTSPSGEERICGGDHLLVIGSREQLAKFRHWLSGAS
jgi:CPA2 family monovalent cation:H+ antiporter-2